MSRTTRCMGMLVFMWFLAGGRATVEAQPGSAQLARRAAEMMRGDLPDQPKAELLDCRYQPLSPGATGGMLVFEGQLQINLMAPVTLKLQAGLQESNAILLEVDDWVGSTERTATFQPGGPATPFRISVHGPSDSSEWIRRGLMLPVVKLWDTSTGELVDAVVAVAKPSVRTVQEFDPDLLGSGHVKRTKGYEIRWGARLPEPGSGLPVLFSGTVKPLAGGVGETILLQAGLISRFGFQDQEQKWVWYGETEVPISPMQSEASFEIAVDCPAGIHVGIGNELYVGDVDLYTEAEREQMQARWEQAAERKPLGGGDVRVDPVLDGISVSNAGYAFSDPGRQNNRAHFQATLSNAAGRSQSVRVVFGFATTDDPELHQPEAWHFSSEVVHWLQPGGSLQLDEQIRCHLRMHELLGPDGPYRPFLLVTPGASDF